MNISQLRAFLLVAEHGSFSEAARVLELSQPAVTMQVQSLEADLGATLFDRRYRRVDLTEAGERLKPFAERILDEIERAREVIDSLEGRVTGRLALVASTTPGQYVLPKLLGAFLEANPEVGVSLSVGDTADVVAAVEAGEAHLGMTGAEIPSAKVLFEELGSDDLVLICPPDHPLASVAQPSVEMVAHARFVLRETGSGTRMVAEQVLRAAGIEPGDLHVVTELGTGEAIVSAVEGGMGISVVSAWVASRAITLGTVASIAAAGFPSRRPLFAVRPTGSTSRAAEALLEHIRERLAAAGAEAPRA